MSKLHEELRNRADSQWYVRITDGAVYGPVDLTTLKSWAAQGRIEPDNEISEDQEIWSTAESLPELEMDWLVELEDGTSYGPFNIQLAPELQQQGTFPPDAPLKHRKTGEIRTMAATKDEQPTFLFDDAVVTQSETPKRKKAKKPQKPTSPPTPAAEVEEPSPSEPKNTEPEPQPEATEPGLSNIEPEPQRPKSKSPSPIAKEALDTDASTNNAVQDDSKEDAPAIIATAPEDRQEIVALRLESLQQSASQARAQLSTTRKALTEQRATSAVMQEQIRKLQEDLRNSESERETSERQQLEQQDTLAQALSESENLNAQLQQLQDHYDRLQIESQNQFEALDQLRSESMQHEQEFKHRLGDEKDRANAKTAILAQAMRLIIQDEDVEHGKLPKELLSTADSGQVQELQNRITQLQQQDERERKRIQALEEQLIATRGSRSRNVITTVLILLVIGLIGALIYVLVHRGADHLHRKAPINTEEETSVQPIEKTALAGLIVTNTEHIDPLTPMSIDAADTSELDLPPEADNQPVVVPRAPPTTWPPLNISRARITETETSCEIAFTYGIFSSDTQLTPEAARDLVTLSNQIRDRHDDFTLLVEGHTDATPISSQVAKYVDNYALGMARAERVKRFLEDQCQLPEGFIRTASAGEADPPHPNDTEASRRKNRTVVLTLTPR